MKTFLDGMKLYLEMIKVSIRSQMQYRASFLFDVIGQVAMSCLDFAGIWVLVSRFGNIGGWTLAEIALLYGLVGSSFALAEAASYGFDNFGSIIRKGDFDRFLLRPRSTALQLAGQQLTLRRIGKLGQGGAILVWALCHVKAPPSGASFFLVIESLVGGFCLFYGLFIFQATITFWTIDGLEAMNIITYGGRETAQYPMSIYGAWLRRLFTYVVPVAAVTYFPVLAILAKPDPLGSGRSFQVCAPFLGILFLIFMLQVWKIGERHYRSTGS